MSLRACSGSFLSRMRHRVTQEKNETKGRKREDGRTGARVALNLFPRVLRDAAIKREWAGAIYARRDYPTDSWQRPDNRRNFGGSASVYGRQIKFITIDLLNCYRAVLSGKGSIGRPSKRNFCNCSIESPARSLPPLCCPLTIIEYIVSTWETSGGVKLAKVRRNVVAERSGEIILRVINFTHFS